MARISHIPPKLNEELNNDPLYGFCALYGHFGHECDGRITRDHSFAYKGENVQGKPFITPVCAKAHGVDGHKDSPELKRQREWVALCRASDADILALTGEREISRLSKAYAISQRRRYLVGIYGQWCLKYPAPALVNKPKSMPASMIYYNPPIEIRGKIDALKNWSKVELGVVGGPYEVLNEAVEIAYDKMREDILKNE